MKVSARNPEIMKNGDVYLGQVEDQDEEVILLQCNVLLSAEAQES
jgi:hypothetical protein